jgi:hypothetical protein
MLDWATTETASHDVAFCPNSGSVTMHIREKFWKVQKLMKYNSTSARHIAADHIAQILTAIPILISRSSCLIFVRAYGPVWRDDSVRDHWVFFS